MPRKKKQEIKINDNDSLSGLMQETYNDACLQISDAQKTINELATSVTPLLIVTGPTVNAFLFDVIV